jgi:hypothetical protein
MLKISTVRLYCDYSAVLAAALTDLMLNALPVSLRVARAFTGDLAFTRRASSRRK